MIIEEKTVFVLGAGASEPFKYPTGAKLTHDICYDTQPLAIAKLLTGEHDERVDIEQKIIKLKEHFELSGRQSIDLFLKDNLEYKDLGKQIIAYYLFPKEQQLNLFYRGNEKNWYIYFWNMIDHGIDNINKHNIHFITFNYDRSLEHFLLTALYNSYSGKKSVEECAQKINDIDIIHVYGCLAPLPWQNSPKKKRPYDPKKATRDDLENVLQNIFLIGEERTSSEQSSTIDKIQRLMTEARFIYFLGFGFDKENLDILGRDFKKAELIWGTAYGLGKTKKMQSIELIMDRLENRNNSATHVYGRLEETIQLVDMDVVEFLKNSIYLKGSRA